MSFFHRKNKNASREAKQAAKQADLAAFQVQASGQRLPTGDRSEMLPGAMNQNQKLAVMQLLRETKD